MSKLPNNVEVYIGSPIEYDSERTIVRKLLHFFSSNNQPAVILANVNLNGRQVDIVVATQTTTLVIEVKGYTRPIKGTENGPWYFQSSTGEWKPTRNYYNQTLDAMHAVKDCLFSFLRKKINYPEAALIFVPNIPIGSVLPNEDFKLKIGGQELIENFDSSFKNSDIRALDEWRGFAKHLNLVKVLSLESIFDSKLCDAEISLENYSKAFLLTYGPDIEGMVDFPCNFNGSAILSDVAAANTNVVITGPSGCGKSLLAKKIGQNCIMQGKIPIFIEAKYFGEQFGKLVNQEVSLLGVHSFSFLASHCLRLNKTLVLIVDGFNECPKSEKSRLARCIAAVTERYKAELVISLQIIHESLIRLNLPEIKVFEPNMEVKKIIASDGKRITEHVENLLILVKSGFEAKLVKEVGHSIPLGASIFALYDAYVRKLLGDKAQEGIKALSLLGNYLIERITFSLSIREVDRIFDKEKISFTLFEQLIKSNVLTLSCDKLSFEHELFLKVFAAEFVIRNADRNVKKILLAISSPEYSASLMLGALDDIHLLDKILNEINSSDLIISCIAGECGEYARLWAHKKYIKLLKLFREEIKQAKFVIDNEGWMSISTISETLASWSEQDIAFIEALPILFYRTKYLDEIFEIIGIMDERLDEVFNDLLLEARENKISLRSSLFGHIYVGHFPNRLAISKICSMICSGCIDFKLDLDKEIIASWVTAQLAKPIISSGQLYLLLTFCRHSINCKILSPYLAELLQKRWRYAPYHLKLDLIDVAYSCRDIDEPERVAILEILNVLCNQTNNIHISSLIIDAIQALGGLEEDTIDHEIIVKQEIKEILESSNDQNTFVRALGVYYAQFDHPYSNAYYEIIHNLPKEKRKSLLSLSLKGEILQNQAKNNYSGSFLSYLIADLSSFDDYQTGDLIKYWTKLPAVNSFSSWDAIGAFLAAHIAVGKLKYPLAIWQYTDTEKGIDQSLRACGEIYYWLSRKDLIEEKRKENCKNALSILCCHEWGSALNAIAMCENFLRSGVSIELMLHSESDKISIIDSFPQEVAEVCRQALMNPYIQKTYFQWSENEIDFAINVLGELGDITDLPLLRDIVKSEDFLDISNITKDSSIQDSSLLSGMVKNKDFIGSAISTIQKIENRFTRLYLK